MAMRNAHKEIKGLKLKEVPAKVKPYFTIDYISRTPSKRVWATTTKKYIQPSSIEPLYHVCFGGMIFSYRGASPPSAQTAT